VLGAAAFAFGRANFGPRPGPLGPRVRNAFVLLEGGPARPGWVSLFFKKRILEFHLVELELVIQTTKYICAMPILHPYSEL
jgi:hypothetical protein